MTSVDIEELLGVAESLEAMGLTGTAKRVRNAINVEEPIKGEEVEPC